jgi:hypothetical protein
MRSIKLFWEANKFPLEMPVKYIRYSSKAELLFDFLFPFFIVAGIFLIINIADPDTSTVLKGIKEINTQTLTFISILAGFNITSISVLATSNSNFLQELRELESKKHPGTNLFQIMMTFFSAAIVTQFLIILLGIVILIVAAVINVPKDFNADWYLWVLFGVWIYTLVITILISIRNLKTLHHIMIYKETK